MERKIIQTWLATWEYLNQPIMSQESNSIWKPSKFWYLYKIRFLEKCWQKSSHMQDNYNQGKDEYRA